MKEERPGGQLPALAEKLLDSPELLRMLGSLLAPSPKTDSVTNGTYDEAHEQAGDLQTDAHGASMSGGGRNARRRELLCALKPYVSAERAQAIDSIEAFAGILDVLHNET